MSNLISRSTQKITKNILTDELYVLTNIFLVILQIYEKVIKKLLRRGEDGTQKVDSKY